MARVLGVSVGLLVAALPLEDRGGGGGAGGSRALLPGAGPLVRVAEGRVHRLVVVAAHHLPGGPPHAPARQGALWVRGEGGEREEMVRERWLRIRGEEWEDEGELRGGEGERGRGKKQRFRGRQTKTEISRERERKARQRQRMANRDRQQEKDV